MKQVTKILKNAIILTMDEDFKNYMPGAIAIQEDKIEAVGNEHVITSYSIHYTKLYD